MDLEPSTSYLQLTQKLTEIQQQSEVDHKALACIRHAADALLFSEEDAPVAVVEAELAIASMRSSALISRSRETYLLELLGEIEPWAPQTAPASYVPGLSS